MRCKESIKLHFSYYSVIELFLISFIHILTHGILSDFLFFVFLIWYLIFIITIPRMLCEFNLDRTFSLNYIRRNILVFISIKYMFWWFFISLPPQQPFFDYGSATYVSDPYNEREVTSRWFGSICLTALGRTVSLWGMAALTWCYGKWLCGIK